jgi:multidrug efflux pump subunit AcrA (membrane-fusion protein)
VDVNLGERDVSLLTKDAPVRLELPSLRDLAVQGRIVRISEAARQGERAAIFPVEIAFTSDNPLMKIGLSARATIEVERQVEALLVPIECVRFAQDGAYIVEKNGKDSRRRSIKTGIVTDDLVEVREGLEEGVYLVRFAKI